MTDLFNDDTRAAQALADETRRRDARRNSGQESIETGDPSDLFSQARQQVDIDDEDRCTDPGGHEFVCTGTAYGGDDESYHGEGRSYCLHCGADGDA